jgi:hypothetical protein
LPEHNQPGINHKSDEDGRGASEGVIHQGPRDVARFPYGHHTGFLPTARPFSNMYGL